MRVVVVVQAGLLPRLRAITLLASSPVDTLHFYRDVFGFRALASNASDLTSGLGLCDLRVRQCGSDSGSTASAAPISTGAVAASPRGSTLQRGVALAVS